MTQALRPATPEMARQAFKDFLWAEQRGECPYCGRKMIRYPRRRHVLAATIDHIVAVARGGTHDESNLCLCCYECNQAKADAPADAWLARLGRGSPPLPAAPPPAMPEPFRPVVLHRPGPSEVPADVANWATRRAAEREATRTLNAPVVAMGEPELREHRGRLVALLAVHRSQGLVEARIRATDRRLAEVAPPPAHNPPGSKRARKAALTVVLYAAAGRDYERADYRDFLPKGGTA